MHSTLAVRSKTSITRQLSSNLWIHAIMLKNTIVHIYIYSVPKQSETNSKITNPGLEEKAPVHSHNRLGVNFHCKYWASASNVVWKLEFYGTCRQKKKKSLCNNWQIIVEGWYELRSCKQSKIAQFSRFIMDNHFAIVGGIGNKTWDVCFWHSPHMYTLMYTSLHK